MKKQRYIEELGLSEYDADQIVQSRAFCDVFEKAYEESRMAKETANWLMSDCMTILNKRQQTTDMLAINGKALGELVKLVAEDKVSRASGKKILAAMFDEDISPLKYAEENGLIMSNDTEGIEKIVREVIEADPKSVSDYKSGKEKALMALFGKCMKQLKGNCSPQVLKEILVDHINRQ